MGIRVSGSVLHRLGALVLPILVGAAGATATLAADVTRPERVTDLSVDRSGDDVLLSWSAVATDVTGQPETISHYHVYRGTTPDFVPDKISGTNRIGAPATESFNDIGAGTGGTDLYYKIGAVDTAGNESNTKAPLIHTPPVLDGNWTLFSIQVLWTEAEPLNDVVGYRVYYGKASGQYESVDDVGLVTRHPLVGLEQLVNWYIAVTAVDIHGNESAFSNEHVDAVAGLVQVRAHDEEELCWGGSTCTPTDPDKIQRANGWQLMVPATFPEGDWVSVEVRLTVESRLCLPGQMGTISKCGPGNDCVSPPCNGGYNPCGDPWDRLVHMFMVLDDCIDAGGSCITPQNLELIRAVTPFGTDAEPPAGSGLVPPRELTMDITPYLPLLNGTKYIGVEIGHFVQTGWWVTVDFFFSERTPSPKPPADGIEIVGFGGAPLPTHQVTIPATATEVKARVFTSGHGGSTYCDGGPNNAMPCTTQAQCPGGVCNPCDEFCHRLNELSANGTPIWAVTPFRTDCSPGPHCSTWNACGTPSCTFPRAGWCPGYIACHHNAPCDNDIDLTSDLPPGGTYDFDYTITPQNGSWPVSVVLYWYE